MARSGYRWRGGAAALAATSLVAGASLADPPPDAAPEQAVAVEEAPALDLEALVRDLDSEDVERRVAATRQLHEHSRLRLRDVEKVLLRDDLSPEQRQRLLGVAEWRFRSEPRAALGFQGPMMGERDTQGVVISNVIPGFPASEVLKAGDRIISADGAPLMNFGAIRPVIVSRDPGDKLRLVLVRDGATVNATVELGSFRQLPESRDLDDAVLAEAWEMRSRRLRGAQQAAVPSGLASERWKSEQVDLAELRTMEIARAGGAQDGHLGVVMGGEPRGGSDDITHMLDAEALRRGHADPNLQQINRLQQVRAQWTSQLEAVDRMLADPDLPAEQRRGLQQSRTALAQAIANHDAEIQRLVRELLERDR